jgi:hypothetical protein
MTHVYPLAVKHDKHVVNIAIQCCQHDLFIYTDLTSKCRITTVVNTTRKNSRRKIRQAALQYRRDY